MPVEKDNVFWKALLEHKIPKKKLKKKNAKLSNVKELAIKYNISKEDVEKKTSSMYSIDGATARYKSTMIGGKLNDIANTSIYNSLECFHAVRKQANWT
ncbi:unnamed protein product [Heligmosomoides polygyrus]|uniref:Phage protein n=1 Tax=Heligmosomoides polygyrus TaxID=6339 RepID=A0A183F6S6_HELPZ|nr:unnamed protein product [Heligmosomoides polygyrus]